MSGNTFTSARQKIERAHRHVNDLEAAIDEYLKRRPLRLVWRMNVLSSQKSIEIKQIEPLPADLPLLIGDAVHNLRTALDHAAFAMVGEKVSNPRNVQFPFKEDEAKLDDEIKKTGLDLAGANVVDRIKAWGPHSKGPNWLWGVHQLDVLDKHRLLIPTAQAAHLTGAEFADLVDPSSAYKLVSLQLGGALKLPVGQGPTLKALEEECVTQPAFAIGFAANTPWGNSAASCVEVLNYVCEGIAKVVASLERASN